MPSSEAKYPADQAVQSSASSLKRETGAISARDDREHYTW